MQFVLGLLIPFIGTTIGGFASGVMIAASVWSLLIPAIEMAEEQKVIAWLPASIGFMFGILFLQYIDYLVKKIKSKKTDFKDNKHKKITMMILAVTLHNIPEGMAVGVAFAGALIGNVGITLSGAIALAIGIGIQNFPEGAIISMPLKNAGKSKFRSFVYGTLSGVVEPIASVITILLTSFVVPILPYFLSFAAGAMIYVVVEELIPEAQEGDHSNLGTIGVALGFIIMMILDVALG